MKTFVTSSPGETVALGKSFARDLVPGDVVALFGNLGSGKTQFASGVCEGLGVTMHATSPTFTLINEYGAPFGIVAHVDLYRISSRRELAELGLEEYFHDRCICLIEWAESVLDMLPDHYYLVKVGYGSTELEREVTIQEVESPRRSVAGSVL